MRSRFKRRSTPTSRPSRKAPGDFVIGGHDKHRVASKISQAQARILAMLLMTIRGTAFLFAGDEIGSEQVPIPSERVQTPSKSS